MQQDIFESWNKLGQNAFRTAQEISAISTRVVQELAEKQIKLAGDLAECTTRAFEAASQAKGAQDILSSQSTALQECSKRVQEVCQSYNQILNKARQDCASLLDQGIQEAGRNFNNNTPSSPSNPNKKAA